MTPSHPPCPLCGDAATAPYWSRVWGDANARVLRCAGCGSFFLDPPRSATEQAAFDDAYDTYIAEREAEVLRHGDRDFAALVDDSIEERWRDVSPWFPPGVSVLEIGAEKGGFLERLSGIASRRVGVDACPEYARTLADLGFEGHRYLEDVPAEARFDRICFFSLLEHVAEPDVFLAAAAARLSDDGMIVLEVPSANEPLLTLYDVPAFKDFYFQAMHPRVYGVAALTRSLERAGLRVEALRHKQRYGLDNHLNWLRKGTPGGDPVLRRILAGQAADAYVSALETAGITDTVYVAARAA